MLQYKKTRIKIMKILFGLLLTISLFFSIHQNDFTLMYSLLISFLAISASHRIAFKVKGHPEIALLLLFIGVFMKFFILMIGTIIGIKTGLILSNLTFALSLILFNLLLIIAFAKNMKFEAPIHARC